MHKRVGIFEIDSPEYSDWVSLTRHHNATVKKTIEFDVEDIPDLIHALQSVQRAREKH